MVPQLDAERITRWCEARVPARARHQVFVEGKRVDGRTIDIVERRVPWDRPDAPLSEWTSFPVARFRWFSSRAIWRLYWRDRNERFHSYDPLPMSWSAQELLDEVDRDPTAIFWG